MPLKRIPRRDAIEKKEFHSRLRFWFDYCDDKQIGPEDVPGVTDWIFVKDGAHLFALHADTKRKAVENYLNLLYERNENLVWQPTASKRGKGTAVAYGPEKVRHTAFYLYFKS